MAVADCLKACWCWKRTFRLGTMEKHISSILGVPCWLVFPIYSHYVLTINTDLVIVSNQMTTPWLACVCVQKKAMAISGVIWVLLYTCLVYCTCVCFAMLTKVLCIFLRNLMRTRMRMALTLRLLIPILGQSAESRSTRKLQLVIIVLVVSC